MKYKLGVKGREAIRGVRNCDRSVEFMNFKSQYVQKIGGMEVLEAVSWRGLRWRSELGMLKVETKQP